MTASTFDCTIAPAACFVRRAVYLLFFIILINAFATHAAYAQQTSASTELTPMQRAIEREQHRLTSVEAEERRDAVTRLGSMKRADSSRVAASALKDPSEIVRATAASAVLSLPADEAAAALLPLLQDKKEFVRQEAAYALGRTRSRTAVEGLAAALEKDKLPGVRGAAAVALGMIGDKETAWHLADTIDPNVFVSKGKRKKKEDNEFVQRAAAHALGQIKSRAAVPALIAAISNKRMSDDVRREAAFSLGLIGDPSAVPALRAALAARDPYLSRTAYEALLKISAPDAKQPS
jgi:HEAT repeat protein